MIGARPGARAESFLEAGVEAGAGAVQKSTGSSTPLQVLNRKLQFIDHTYGRSAH
jgi:hypothetical protein